MNSHQMGENNRQSIVNILISSIWLLIWWSLLFFLLWLNNKRNQVPILTGQVISKPIRDINLTPIQNVNNVLSGGLSWTDYITQYEKFQPNLSWTISNINEVMHNYLYRNRLTFALPAWKNGLLLITTKNPLVEGKDIFIAIWWSTKWQLHKEKSIKTDTENRFLFDINNLPIATFVPWLSLFDNTIDWKVQIGVLVGEKDNSIESVTMIFY